MVNEGTIRKTGGIGTTFIGGGFVPSPMRMFTHRGAIEAGVGSIEVRMNSAFEAAGVVRADPDATFRFGNGTHAPVASLFRLAGGSLTTASPLTLTGAVRGHGTMGAGFTIAGIIYPDTGGRLITVSGAYTQAVSGRLFIEIAEAPAALTHGRLGLPAEHFQARPAGSAGYADQTHPRRCRDRSLG